MILYFVEKDGRGDSACIHTLFVLNAIGGICYCLMQIFFEQDRQAVDEALQNEKKIKKKRILRL